MNKLTEEEKGGFLRQFGHRYPSGHHSENTFFWQIEKQYPEPIIEWIESLLKRRLKEQSKKLREVIEESYRQGARDGEYLTCIEADEKLWESSIKQQLEKLKQKYLE